MQKGIASSILADRNGSTKSAFNSKPAFLVFFVCAFLSTFKVHAAPLPNGVIGNTLCLNADLGPEDRLYSRIESVLGKGAVEAPSDSVYKPIRPHVRVGSEDSEVKNYFAILALEPTDVNLDRVPFSQGSDRSRTEIKIAPGSGPQARFHAREGDTYIYSWRFKIAPGMRFSSAFTHLHQIMAQAGPLAGRPLITFTARADRYLSVIYYETRVAGQSPKHSRLTTLGRVPLAKVMGSWIDVEEKVYYSLTNGKYEVTIRDLSGNNLLSIKKSDLSTWRQGANHMRPKWGIYRKHDAALNQNIEDYVYFANFAITRGNSPDSTCR
ncbi:hypothetical protein [Hydrocarboniphaga effusa]|uniref:hypothetical protein n=1 Tax=Hydrocarboniphaga effusa TaxID=243629 RepID=UPI003BAD2DC1